MIRVGGPPPRARHPHPGGVRGGPLRLPGTLASQLRRVQRLLQIDWYARWRRTPVAHDVVLWVSDGGTRAGCQPRALFDALLADPRYSHLRHVWAVCDPSQARDLRRHRRVSAVAVDSARYLKLLATAKYLVTNGEFPQYFVKRPGQVYLNTWRGMPLRRLGYDTDGDRLGCANTVRNLLSADYLLSAGPQMTESVYRSGYRLDNVYPGTVLEVGSPRTDAHFVAGTADRVREQLADLGIVVSQRLAVVVPATDAGAVPGSPGEVPGKWVATLRATLGPRWTVLAAPSGRPGDGVPDAALLVAAADLLVTDGSDLLFDYLSRDRPVIFVSPTSPSRDFVRPIEQWPGPVVRDGAELGAAAARVRRGHDDHAERRRSWRTEFCPQQDGSASERVIDAVFAGKPDRARARHVSSDGRTRLLLYTGGMKPNGITSSALNLLRTIDHEQVDVTCFFQESADPAQVASAAQIDPRVRILLRSGGFSSTLADYRRARAVYTGGRFEPGTLPRSVRAVFSDEWSRCFGSARFDRIADFSGYGAMWGLVLLDGPAPVHAMWLHNEMIADSGRVVAGRRPLHDQLHSVFSLYGSMDRLVSVSAALREVNRAQLAQFAPASSFVHARNTLDVERIDRLAVAEPADASARRVLAWLTSRSGPVFVSAGRLSSEKNHGRLLRAFAEARRQHPQAALLILGDGVQRGHVESLVQELGLGDSCLVAGFQPNPFQFMRHCHCLVLSSDHEGQPMVVLEALHLGLHVITTRFSSVESLLPDGAGLVVRRDHHALAEGMHAYLQGALRPSPFDSAAYNAEAMAEFYAALDIEPAPTSSAMPSRDAAET